MNEAGLIAIIKNITKSEYIGDDCAYLRELGITISQDSLVEDVHFRLKWMSPYELGRKTALVNISDILASNAIPKYMTISLSLPQTLKEDFVAQFYNGIMDICSKYHIEVVGGDITGSDKVFVSATVIGALEGRKASSRSGAKVGYKVLLFGEHGSAAAGLKLLERGIDKPDSLIRAHKSPMLCNALPLCNGSFAMMDTSDGLADALIKIANASNVTLEIDFEKIPFNVDIKIFEEYEDLMLYGGEDYGLVAVVPENLDVKAFVEIGKAVERKKQPLVINKNGKVMEISSFEERTFNHFEK